MKIKHLAMAVALLLPMTALAADDGMPHAMGSDMSMQGDMQHMFLQKKTIDGYTVSFHVMPASKGMQHGGSHNFMVKIEQDGKVAEISAANSKVIAPDGNAVSKMMMKMGDWYMAGYDLKQQGHYQLMVLFKTHNGTKHFGGVYYPGKE